MTPNLNSQATRILSCAVVLFALSCPAFADYHVTVQERQHTEPNIAIFHNIVSAQHWATEMGGKVIPGKDNTFYVVYNETVWESTPNDWKSS